MEHRTATDADIPAIAALMARASDALQRPFLTPAQVAASRHFMGLDTQLIADGTYFVIEDAGRIIGCGGWSPRATLFGGDASAVKRESRLLDRATEAAKVRAMYVDPDRARQGIGRRMLGVCEGAARVAGFARVELMATLAGEPLYRACGYVAIEAVTAEAEWVEPVPMVRMAKDISRPSSRAGGSPE